MFSRDSDKKERSYTSSSVIGTEMQINGNIKCQGHLVLKGKVKGNIECENLNISSEGNLRGNIKSHQSVIGGNFEGDVFSESLAIESSANIKGNLYYNSLEAEPGAKLDVQFIMGLEKEKEKEKKVKSSSKNSVKASKAKGTNG
ncbi:MAG: hypothetical protein CMP34_01135 [Rickettsiales bacterium]|nr:hypothetical protein [Rickettsiales bacterium]|tara:strand:+ start:389 stop:820 length:432 start_codon:yes stop_codon:yes gene_type:complete